MEEQANFSYIQQLSGGDKDFEIELLKVIKRELPGEIEVFRKNTQNRAYKNASDSVHKLKHKISILGFEKAYHLAELYEAELREGQNNKQPEFEEILEKMLRFIKSQKSLQ
ncbi:Hpt domain-containing protein [Salegentibacter sp. BLCTC]|uniref:Hpt domain-containing protein n=1 Tax=Salegentibacter sp. BLCTC TaxID=2697368 RepID=UPI00187B9EEB|nr:Hpt domain-containing protein [Salegentibacter sp. BLCTC]MBE7640586.1 Hpt domain-containing protein [Salegentibacter sp. BLCTC]